ncbi:hypothetical protein [Agrobacterium fabrum]|uniref:hypothetical protein n=1 Tax=Agrobacterium fabrum TaxID=1176649 RepID=UPI001573C02A|nr:hypothetical protein [Agrobacterium fabrum]WCK77906.1 hypothetical protein G6L39_014505 [Agrobacterium fabrum]
MHGVVNEILCSNLDPTCHRVRSGFAHPDLQTPGASGRRREVDFAVELLGNEMVAFCAEVKWAGSSHCSQENVLLDLCRLQLIKNVNPKTDCVFVLAGSSGQIDKLFSSGILEQGTNCLLHRSRTGAGISQRGATRRTKRFRLEGNCDHASNLAEMLPNVSAKIPKLPDSIFSHLLYSTRSTQGNARFQSLVWAVEAGDLVEC